MWANKASTTQFTNEANTAGAFYMDADTEFAPACTCIEAEPWGLGCGSSRFCSLKGGKEARMFDGVKIHMTISLYLHDSNSSTIYRFLDHFIYEC